MNQKALWYDDVTHTLREGNYTEYYLYDHDRFQGPTFRRVSWQSAGLILTSAVKQKLANIIAANAPDQYGITGKKPIIARGSNIWLAPNCPFAIDDVRKNYNIKRNIDSADAIVINDISGDARSRRSDWLAKTKDTANIEPHVAYISVSYSSNKTVDYNAWQHTIKSQLASDWSCSYDEIEIIAKGDLEKRNIAVEKVIVTLLRNNITVPIYNNTALEFRSNIPLNLDLLKMLIVAGRSRGDSKSVENVGTVLMGINNTDWRDKQSSMWLAAKMCGGLSYSSRALCQAFENINTKAMNTMYDAMNKSTVKPCNQEDFDLCIALLDDMVFNHQMFGTLESMNTILADNFLTTDIVSMYKNLDIRCTNKQFTTTS